MEISESVCRIHVIIFKNFNERVNSTGRLLASHHSVVSESLPSIEGKDVAGLPLSLLREGGGGGAQVTMGEPARVFSLRSSLLQLDLIASCLLLIVALS